MPDASADLRARVRVHLGLIGVDHQRQVMGVWVARSEAAYHVWDPAQCRCQGATPAHPDLSVDQAVETVIALRPGHRRVLAESAL